MALKHFLGVLQSCWILDLDIDRTYIVWWINVTYGILTKWGLLVINYSLFVINDSIHFFYFLWFQWVLIYEEVNHDWLCQKLCLNQQIFQQSLWERVLILIHQVYTSTATVLGSEILMNHFKHSTSFIRFPTKE